MGIQSFESFKAGIFKQQFQFKSFSPTFINNEWSWQDTRVHFLLSEASRLLGELNAFSHYIPDVDLFIHMHIAKEANTSSRIEGTRTEIDEALLEKEEDLISENKDDWKEVRNYIEAINMAVKELDRLPLSTRLIKQTHKVLMDSVRGQQKLPGEFRKSQNWIGGTSIADAMFVPPSHEEVPELMSDLEKFIHNDKIFVPPLIRIALSHYQFETIHPFLDGNGRIGRLLITLSLVHAGILTKPCLYLSSYFEKNKGDYYDALSVVRAQNDISYWVKFFLNAVIDTSQKGISTFRNILSLKEKADSKILTLSKTNSKNAEKALRILFSNPIQSMDSLGSQLSVSKPTAAKLIRMLEDLNILRKFRKKSRTINYIFDDYLQLFM